jgi:hypothetical protein
LLRTMLQLLVDLDARIISLAEGLIHNIQRRWDITLFQIQQNLIISALSFRSCSAAIVLYLGLQTGEAQKITTGIAAVFMCSVTLACIILIGYRGQSAEKLHILSIVTGQIMWRQTLWVLVRHMILVLCLEVTREVIFEDKNAIEDLLSLTGIWLFQIYAYALACSPLPPGTVRRKAPANAEGKRAT